MLSCTVKSAIHPASCSSSRYTPSFLLPSVAISKNALLSFQSLTHSFQFAIPRIPCVINALRTLCAKHPGVGGHSSILLTSSAAIHPSRSSTSPLLPRLLLSSRRASSPPTKGLIDANRETR